MARSNLNWSASPAEVYAEAHWKEHGFDAKLVKRYQSKSVYEISRDGLTDTYEIPYTVKDFKGFMNQFHKCWDLLVEVNYLRKKLREKVNEK